MVAIDPDLYYSARVSSTNSGKPEPSGMFTTIPSSPEQPESGELIVYTPFKFYFGFWQVLARASCMSNPDSNTDKPEDNSYQLVILEEEEEIIVELNQALFGN